METIQILVLDKVETKWSQRLWRSRGEKSSKEKREEQG